MCSFPPRPCARFSYFVPVVYTEVGDGKTHFKGLPGVELQLGLAKSKIPFSTEENDGAFSYHAHTITPPHVAFAFNEFPCGGAPMDQLCFNSMSEHLGRLWKTGEGDLLQPAYLAWSASPKACLIKGALESGAGNSVGSFNALNMCSTNRSFMRRFLPSRASICTGWGIHFPRYGTVINSDQTTASLVIASRIKSLGAEVFKSVPSYPGEIWQMISPQSSACFREGQNVALLRLKNVSELGRLNPSKLKNYLYVRWKPVSCTRDIPYIASTYAWLSILKAACAGLK